MRGDLTNETAMWSYVSPEQRVPADHPLRPIKKMVDAALRNLSPRFDAMYSDRGRPSIPPERLLCAQVLQALYSIRSERMLMEQLDYTMLFRWFCDMNLDDPVWDVTVYTKNRDRLIESDVAQAFFDQVQRQARATGLLSDEHFTVDGTMIEAWAGHKSFVPRDDDQGPSGGSRNPGADFHGERRTNETHWSITDKAARMFRKGPGKEAKLAYLGHALMENRHGLIVGTSVTPATGYAEREAAIALAKEIAGNHRVTLGADKGYDSAEFVQRLRERNVVPHVAQNDTNRRSAIDERTTRHPGYAISQRVRKRVEEAFGWMKTIGPMRKTKFRGCDRIGWQFTFTAAIYNLVRMRNLQAETG
ncbi:MAG TPA: IS5 family transposase [Candidatus Baltobacteraceae bacterium]|nr:IS5 family transposase [Candidatus Baltobacteraceae bacterium]